MRQPPLSLPLLLLLPSVQSLQNGAALTPPMGWLSWQRYRCSESFNETLIRDTADALVSEGYKDAGYEYVCLDDCWQGRRGEDGHLTADPKRFPSGIKSLADYVHSKGLKLGLYTAVGSHSCTGRPALGCDFDAIPKCEQAQRDIDDFVSWDIDHIKVDGCGGFDIPHMNESYAIVGQFLQNATGRRGKGPVVYHPSNLGFEFPRQFRELTAIANQWRFFNDVQASWGSLSGIIEEIGAGQPECIPGPLPANCSGRLSHGHSTYCASYCVERDAFLSVPGRGGWHDPDMLLIGNTPCNGTKGMSCNNLTHDEEMTNMAIWALSSAPLQISVDIRAVPAASKAILQNREIIAVDQDPLGRMGFRFLRNTTSGAQGWKKELLGGAVAVVLLNMQSSPGGGVPASGLNISFDFRDVGFAPDTLVRVRDLFAQRDLGVFTQRYMSVNVPVHGAHMLRLEYEPKYRMEL